MDKNFVITIARGYGSGGKTIGKMLSKELGIPFYDREILYMASDDSGINLGLFQKYDEEVSKGLFDSSTHQYNGKMIPPEDSKFTSKENLFNYQAKIIKTLAKKESCVIVGRCADYILKEVPNVINIFIHADLEFRKERAIRVNNLSPVKAEEAIGKMDKRRANYYNYHSGEKWGKATNYDLSVNSSHIGIDNTVECIKAFIDSLPE